MGRINVLHLSSGSSDERLPLHRAYLLLSPVQRDHLSCSIRAGDGGTTVADVGRLGRSLERGRLRTARGRDEPDVWDEILEYLIAAGELNC